MKLEFPPQVIWFTGLPSSGKTTLALALAQELKTRGLAVEHLDGDGTRKLIPNLGFTREERNRHIRYMGFLASRLEANQIVVLASFVSPYLESREYARSVCNRFVEIHVSTPLSECEKRDVKGLYAQARKGQVKNFTGVDDPYENPTRAELTIDTSNCSEEDALERILSAIQASTQR